MLAIMQRMTMERAGASFGDPCSAVPDASTSKRSSTLVTANWVSITEQSQPKAKKGRILLHDVEKSVKNERPNRTSTLAAQKSPTLLFHIPQPLGPITINQITETIVFEGASDAWFGELLPRYGHEKCYDLAVQALALASWAGRGLPDGRPRKAFETMGNAIIALQIRMKVNILIRGLLRNRVLDEMTLMSIAALVPFEGVLGRHSLLVPAHLDGLTAVLLHYPSTGSVPPVSKRICHWHCCDQFVVSVERGIASPFENLNPSFYGLEESEAASPVKRLRAIGNELTIRLPRFILAVRHALKSGITEIEPDGQDIFTMARELASMRNDSAESHFLHCIGVGNSLTVNDAGVIKYCYSFDGAASFEAGAYYWLTRATLLRLLLRLSSALSKSYTASLLPSSNEIESELQRYLSNIMMSASYARDRFLRTHHRLLIQMMVVCHGSLQDCPSVQPRCTGNSQVLFEWFLANANRAYPADGPLTMQDMDRMAKVFGGGSLS